MLTTIQLNNQLRIETNKVDNIFPNRPLAAKTKIIYLLVANTMPEFSLHIGGRAPQLTRGCDNSTHAFPDAFLRRRGSSNQYIIVGFHFTSLPPFTR